MDEDGANLYMKSEASESFDFAAFNVGDYFGAVDEKIVSENISKVLYPNDEQTPGKRLRLEQQHFLTNCSLRDLLRIHENSGSPLDKSYEKHACQLNGTHPALAIL